MSRTDQFFEVRMEIESFNSSLKRGKQSNGKANASGFGVRRFCQSSSAFQRLSGGMENWSDGVMERKVEVRANPKSLHFSIPALLRSALKSGRGLPRSTTLRELWVGLPLKCLNEPFLAKQPSSLPQILLSPRERPPGFGACLRVGVWPALAVGGA